MAYLDRQDLRAAAGQRIIMGFPGDQVDAELKEVLAEVRPAGIILFTRNVGGEAAAAREMCRELKGLVGGRPLLMCVDQEGGRVARLREGVTSWPPMRRLGEIADPALATHLAGELGRALGEELGALGFDVDFAPVLDVDTHPDNPVIGDRALARDPERVAALGTALAQGLEGAGVAACGKHFPGHGDTHVDSHLALPTIDHPRSRLETVEWPPFRAAIAGGISSIMSAHVAVSALAPGVPATLSRLALGDPLRKEMGFAGIIISDDVEMRGLADLVGPEEAARRGDLAGVDVFLACHHYDVTLRLFGALVHHLEEDVGRHAAKGAQARRIAAWATRFFRPAPPPGGPRPAPAPAHLALAERIVRAALPIA